MCRIVHLLINSLFCAMYSVHLGGGGHVIIYSSMSNQTCINVFLLLNTEDI